MSKAFGPVPHMVPVSSLTTTVRDPKQIVPLPTALHGSNDGGGGFKVCITGCPAKAAVSGISIASAIVRVTAADAIERFIVTPCLIWPTTGPAARTGEVSSTRLHRLDLPHAG